MIGDADMKLKIPQYSNSMLNCPKVSKHALYKSDCSTPSTDFINADSLTETEGFLYAELKDGTVPATYYLCAKVYASNIFIDVPSLVFTVKSDKISSSDPKPYIIQINSTDDNAQTIMFD